MLLSAVLVRFYRSFNFDYLQKFMRSDTSIERWETVGDEFYPYVTIPIEPAITTVVGANESGKTHLLTAIEKGLTGQGLGRRDFCRNSKFFSVEAGQLRWPDIGFEWTGITQTERQGVEKATG